MTVDSDALAYFAAQGEYYDSADEIPDDILLSRIDSMARVLGNRDQFPNADFATLENAWPTLCGLAAGRLLL